jgi:omega-amidase
VSVPEARLEVALVQAELHWQDAEANRRHLSELMDRQPGCHLYVLPETFTTGFLGDAGIEVEDFDGTTVSWMREQALAREASVCGSLVLADAEGVRRNSFVFMPPTGTPSRYDKRHRFGFGGEDERYAAGDHHTVVDYLGWRIDLQVCYDLRFPVWCRNNRDFDIQLFVANWPAPRVEAWRALLKARAIENQAYVIGVNRSGVDGNDIAYPGCSGAWSMEGHCMVEMGRAEAVARISLERAQLDDFRRDFPFLEDADSFRLDEG